MISIFTLIQALASNFVLINFVAELPTITSNEEISELVTDSAIRRQVSNDFTLTQEDRDYIEHMNDDLTIARQGRIVEGQEAALGKEGIFM